MHGECISRASRSTSTTWNTTAIPRRRDLWDVIKSWKADKFDADYLMGLYQKAGAKYYVAMGCHHDNFDMWNSKYQPRWNAANSGPKKDILGSFGKAARQRGMRCRAALPKLPRMSFFGPLLAAFQRG